MSAPHDLATKLALLKVLTGQLGDVKKAADCEIRDTWRPKDRNTAVLPDGTAIGTVGLTKGRTVARLADEAAYRAWVEQAHPDEIETVTTTRVNPAFTERIMSAARQLGMAIDATTGEQVPGVTVETGDPFPTVRLEDGAAALVAAAWQSGQLAELIASLIRPAITEGGAA